MKVSWVGLLSRGIKSTNGRHLSLTRLINFTERTRSSVQPGVVWLDHFFGTPLVQSPVHPSGLLHGDLLWTLSHATRSEPAPGVRFFPCMGVFFRGRKLLISRGCFVLPLGRFKMSIFVVYSDQLRAAGREIVGCRQGRGGGLS